MITKTRLGPRLVLVRCDSQYELAATFLRVQEHYESRRFAGRVFSLEQFMDWYASTFGKFTYFEDWSGFNVPSEAFEAFYQGRFDPLLEKEKRLLRLLRHEPEPFYVIALSTSSTRNDLRHELAHALYFTSSEYRNAVDTALAVHDTADLEKQLHERGYCKRVIRDEVHATLIAPDGVPVSSTRRTGALRRRLRAIFQRHSLNLVNKC